MDHHEGTEELCFILCSRILCTELKHVEVLQVLEIAVDEQISVVVLFLDVHQESMTPFAGRMGGELQFIRLQSCSEESVQCYVQYPRNQRGTIMYIHRSKLGFSGTCSCWNSLSPFYFSRFVPAENIVCLVWGIRQHFRSHDAANNISNLLCKRIK